MRQRTDRRAVLQSVGILFFGTSTTSAPAIAATQSSPTADFSHTPSTPNPDESVTFDGSSSSDSDGSIEDYTWRIDGNYQGSGETFQDSFDTGGSYTVELQVTDNGGNTDNHSETISVENPAPTADFSYSPSSPAADETVTFDGSPSSDPDGSIEDYTWRIDGNYQGTGQTFQHSFSTDGSYTVELQVTDNGEKTDTTNQTIDIGGEAPKADFTYSPDPPNPDESVTFDGSPSSDPDGSIEDYTWRIDGNYESPGQTFQHSFDTGGSYTVELQVTDNGENTDSYRETITVENPAPTADFSYSPSSPAADETVTFDGSPSSDPDGSIEDYTWRIDGNYESPGQTFQHSFSTDGTYTIELQVTDNGEKTDTTNQTIDIGGQGPEADFTYSPDPPNPDQTVTFDGSSSSDPDGSIEDYVWRIDGNYQGPGPTMEHSFDTGGSYTVELQVTDNGGKTDNHSETISVENPVPSADFSYAPDTPNPDEIVTFDASPSSDPDGSIEDYTWRIDGNYESPGQTFQHSFSTEGTYTIELQVTDNGEKTDTTRQTVNIGDQFQNPTSTLTPAEASTPTFTEASTSTPAKASTPTPTEASTRTTQTEISTERLGANQNETSTSTPTVTLEGQGGGQDGTDIHPGVLGLLGLGGAGGGAWWITRNGDGGDDGSSTETTTTNSGTDSTRFSGGSTPSQQPSSSSDHDGLNSSKSTGPSKLSIPTKIPRAPELSVDYNSLTNKEIIGGGGNADVTKATLPTPDGNVVLAVKEPRLSGTLRTDKVERMLNEAETWDKLDDHNHVVGVVDYGSEPMPWIAMEYMDGGHLGERSGELEIPQALWTAIAITNGVRHAHTRGVAHLDLKPENVLFRSVQNKWDVPKVGDWGLSRHLLEHSKSVEGMSPHYAAPEQFEEAYGSTDNVTDVYQLGAVFYELFTGQPPFEGRPTQVMRAVMDKQPTPPSEIADVPDILDEPLLTALAKEKDDRYDDIIYLRDDLQDLLCNW